MSPGALEWMRRFRRYIRTERRLSPHTDKNYARDLHALVSYCDTHEINDWNRLDAQHVRLFAARSHAQGLSPLSIRRRLSAARSFYRFLLREQVVRTNPALDIRAPKSPRLLPDTVDTDQMARLLEMPAGEGPLAARDLALMELLYSSGLRLAEIAALNWEHLNLSDRSVRVLGKGRKERVVPVGAKALGALAEWRKAWPALGSQLAARRVGTANPTGPAPDDPVFTGRNGRRLSHRGIQARVAYWGRRQGLGVPVHPHLFRHSFASHLLESSGELRAVQELLGHANIATTQIYTHLDFQHLARIYDATHPRARKKR
jgi:integrase/recombinase XerC